MKNLIRAPRILVFKREPCGAKCVVDVVEPWRACFWDMLVETRKLYAGEGAELVVEYFEREPYDPGYVMRSREAYR